MGGTSVTDLAKPFSMSLPAVSKHLRILEEAGLIIRERQGRVHRLYLNPHPLKSTEAWIVEYRQLWEERLSALAKYLESEGQK